MPQQPPPLKKKNRLPLAASALGYPGAGQCLQGRWAVGLFFAGTFTLTFIALAAFILWPPIYNFRCVILQLGGPGVAPLPYDTRRILESVALLTLLYIWNVADIWWRSRHKYAPPR